MQAAATANRFLLLSESYQQADLSSFQDSIVRVAFSDQADQSQGGRRLIVFDSEVEQFGVEFADFRRKSQGGRQSVGGPGAMSGRRFVTRFCCQSHRKRFVGVNAG